MIFLRGLVVVVFLVILVGILGRLFLPIAPRPRQRSRIRALDPQWGGRSMSTPQIMGHDQLLAVDRLIDRLRRLSVGDVHAINNARGRDAGDVVAAIGAASAAGRMIALEDADEAVHAAVSTARQRAVLTAGYEKRGDWEGAATCASDAAIGLIARDLIGSSTYWLLTAPVAAVVGPLHPDDVRRR